MDMKAKETGAGKDATKDKDKDGSSGETEKKQKQVSFVPPDSWYLNGVPNVGKVRFEIVCPRREKIQYLYREKLGYRFCNWGAAWNSQCNMLPK